MQIAGLVHSRDKTSLDRIAEILNSSTYKRYGYSIEIPVRHEHGFLFIAGGTKVLTEGPLGVAIVGFTTSVDTAVVETVGSQMGAGSFEQGRSVIIGDSLGGTHCLVSINEFGCAAWSSLPGHSPAYYCQIGDTLVVCSRPGVLKATFKLPPSQEYFRQICSIGYPLDDSSPYEGARCILGGTALRMWDSRAQIVPYQLPIHGLVPRDESEAVEAEAVFQKEINRATTAVSQFKNVELRLSGGKDSRLVASALHATGLKPVARTAGRLETPIGRMIAKTAGLPFISTEGSQAVGGNADVIDQCLRALRATDSFVHFQGNNGLYVRDPVLKHQDAVLAGQIELHKGGYARGRSGLNRKRAIKKLEECIIHDYTKDRTYFAKKLAERFAYDQYADPMDILYFPYAGTRASRYLEVSYLRYQYKMMPIFPPNDERVYMAVSNLDRTRRASELSLYRVTEANCPGLIEIPIHGDTYVFQRENPPVHSVDNADKKDQKVRKNHQFSSPEGPEDPSSVAFMREYVSASNLRETIQDCIDPELYGYLGIGPRKRDKETGIKRVGVRGKKVLMRCFMIAIAMDNWNSV